MRKNIYDDNGVMLGHLRKKGDKWLAVAMAKKNKSFRDKNHALFYIMNNHNRSIA